ncbi:uncharacterized protein LOC117320739 [Pecten maximus]|uniref:uncharacterized protein LOC117320739 n=1 Tax=Pecten maximus TaxID=6579 RepID=UPI001458A299|nr:uncharacterized protein LOC117320739 [Pecten maximus]
MSFDMKNSDIISMIEKKTIKEVATDLLEKGKQISNVSLKLNSYYKKVKRIGETNAKLKKTRNVDYYKEFLEGEFRLPSYSIDSSGNHDLTEQELTNLQPNNKTAAYIISEIAHERRAEKSKTFELQQEVEKKDEELTKVNIEKKYISIQSGQKSAELKRTRTRETYYRNKVAKFEGVVSANAEDHRCEMERKIHSLQQENLNIRKQLTEMDFQREVDQEVFDAQQKNVVNLFDEDSLKYTPELQTCVHTLLCNHVSTTRISPVIEACLKLVGKTPNRLPSATTINNMNVQRLVLSQKQLSEEISKKENTTIETDETSKFGTKFGVYAVRDSDGNPYVLGLRELVTKSGKDTLQAFKEILFDLDQRYYNTQSLTSQNMLFHIRNTMSDRAATEMKFNQLLETYRCEVLPEMVQDWNDLDEEDRNVLSRLNNFFCGLHSLVHIAEVANQSILEVEKTNFNEDVPIFNKKFQKSLESGTLRLIRTCCKAFSYNGDAKSGCHGPFMTYIKDFLKENGMQSLPLTPFKGNRFNILFHNAGVVYFFHENMVSFLKDHGSNQWVLHDLNTSFFIAGCKALGLICKLVTSPLWNLIEKKEIHIMDMNRHYLQLTTFLSDASNNLDDFMCGQILPFGEDTYVKRDKLYEKLITPSQYDGETCTILGIILPAIAKLAKNHFRDHLPCGKFANPSEELKETTKSVAKHNKFSESVFAYLDGLMRYKPHIKTLSAEAYVMFSMNKTKTWLESKDNEEVNSQLEDAYKNVARTREFYKARRDEIVQKKEAVLQETLKKNQDARRRKEAENLLQTNDILFWGLWQTVKQVDVMLETMKDKEKLDALKSQMRFRKNILRQTSNNPKIYNFSKSVNKKRKDLSWNEMAENVKTLILESFTLPSETSSKRSGDERLSLNGKDVRHKFVIDEQTQWYDGHVISQVSQRDFVPFFLSDFKFTEILYFPSFL